MHVVRAYLLGHVAVLLPEGEVHRARAVALVEYLHDVGHGLAAHLQLLRVVVAQDIAQLRALRRARDGGEVVKALVALGVPRRLAAGQGGVELRRHQRGVHHDVLGAARVDVHARDVHDRGAGVEVLIYDLALGAAVERIGKVRAEPGDVEVRRAAADLLVRREAHGYAPVRDLAALQLLYERHYLRDARLVVRAEEGVPARGDERPALERGQVRELPDAERPARAELQVAAVVVFYDAGLDVFPGKVRRRVHVRDEAQAGRALVPRRRGQVAVDIAGVRHLGVRHAQLAQLIHEQPREVELPRRRGRDAYALLAGGADLCVLYESLVCSHFALPTLVMRYISEPKSPGRRRALLYPVPENRF